MSVTSKTRILMKAAIIYLGFFLPFVRSEKGPSECLCFVSCMSLLLLLLWSVCFCCLFCSCGVVINKNVVNLKLLYILLLLLIIN